MFPGQHLAAFRTIRSRSRQIQKVYPAQLEVVDALKETDRNEGGFGHTGV